MFLAFLFYRVRIRIVFFDYPSLDFYGYWFTIVGLEECIE